MSYWYCWWIRGYWLKVIAWCSQKLNCRRFGLAYSSLVANPGDMIALKILRSKSERRKTNPDGKLLANVERVGTLDEMVSILFCFYCIVLLMGNCVYFINYGGIDGILHI